MNSQISVIAKLKEELDKTFQDLENIWRNVGLTSDQINLRQQTAAECINEILSDIFQDEIKMQAKLIKNIEDMKLNIKDLFEQLRLDPYITLEGLSLIERANELKVIKEKLELLKKKRLSQYQELFCKEKLLSHRLQCCPYSPSHDIIPSEEYLSALSMHVSELQKDENSKHNEYLISRNSILELCEELNYKALSTIEKNSIYGLPEEFFLTSDNFLMLEKLKLRLEHKKQENKELIDNLMKEIDILWNRLKINSQHCARFLTGIQGFSNIVINKLELELKHLQELKLQNIKEFIEEIRTELTVWWDRCCFGLEQRKKFKEFSDENYTEELLMKHENEANKMKQLYNEMNLFYAKFEKWQQLWTRLVQLEENSHNPNRFNNRGGALLKEEKDRRHLQKELPSLENQLFQEVEKWEQMNHATFAIFDVPFVQFVNMKYVVLQQQKENDKKNKINSTIKKKQSPYIKASSSNKKRTFVTQCVNSPFQAKRLDLGLTKQITPLQSSIQNEIESNTIQTGETSYADFMRQDDVNSTLMPKKCNQKCVRSQLQRKKTLLRRSKRLQAIADKSPNRNYVGQLSIMNIPSTLTPHNKLIINRPNIFEPTPESKTTPYKIKSSPSTPKKLPLSAVSSRPFYV